MKIKTNRVWVGFSEGKPHVFMNEAVHVVAVYPTKWEAKIEYEDTRPATLVFHVAPRKRRARTSTASHE